MTVVKLFSSIFLWEYHEVRGEEGEGLKGHPEGNVSQWVCVGNGDL